MPIEWKKAQLDAITAYGRNIIVSAAAGSGKTAALTERVIRSVTREENPLDITRILAVTFTRAAAAELRDRISKALSEKIRKNPGNRHLMRQALLLGSAKICTIDSFCADVVKSNFRLLPVSPGFRVAEETEANLLRKSVINEVLGGFYDSGDEEFNMFADHVTSNLNDADLTKLMLVVYGYLLDIPEGLEFLKTNADILQKEAEAPYFETRSGIACKRELADILDYSIRETDNIQKLLKSDKEDEISEKYGPAFDADRAFCVKLAEKLSECKSYGEIMTLIDSYRASKLESVGRATSVTLAVKALRNEIKSRITNLKKQFFPVDGQTATKLFKESAVMCSVMYGILKKFEKKLRDEKLMRNICDFDDLRRYAYGVLVDENGGPTDVAKEYSERFDEIFIDEYQDVTEVQDRIFRAISDGRNRFMVGDVKQCIYAFRGAEPTLFSEYRNSFVPFDRISEANEDAGASIFMSDNFRSDENILKFVNLVCDPLFRACGESMGYTDKDRLIFSKKTASGYVSPKVKISIVVTKPEAVATGAVKEKDYLPAEGAEKTTQADYVASEISKLLSTGKLANGEDIKPEDIAVLCRTRNEFSKICEALNALGIHTNADGSTGKNDLSRPEVSLVISLLGAVDNPQRDIPLTAVMRSPLFGFTMDELTRIRLASTGSVSMYDAVKKAGKEENALGNKCRLFVFRLDSYRETARSLPTDKFLRYVYRDTSILAVCKTNEAKSDLTALYERARRFESGSFRGLYNFIRYINQSISEDEKRNAADGEIMNGAVSVLTMHHSKGLEYPVCFVCGCDKKFNDKMPIDNLAFNRQIGFGLCFKDPTGLGTIETPVYTVAKHREKIKRTKEEMRLLYVAMTRAKERLYLTAEVSKMPEEAEMRIKKNLIDNSNYSVTDCDRYSDWILPSASDALRRGDDYLSLEVIYGDSKLEKIKYEPPERHIFTDGGEIQNAENFAKELEKRFSFEYPNEYMTKIPSKLSVSKLYPGILDESEDDSQDIREWEGETPKRLKTSKIKPKFLSGRKKQKPTATEKGTATHLFLQFCDFENCEKNGVENEIGRLTEEGFIPKHLAALINRRDAENFFVSELFQSLKTAKKIYREQRFELEFPADAFANREKTANMLRGETVLVQGATDLFFIDENDRLILCDYKTDNFGTEDDETIKKKLFERYDDQLSYYASALARIYSKPPDKVCIYSVPLGRSFDISVRLI